MNCDEAAHDEREQCSTCGSGHKYHEIWCARIREFDARLTHFEKRAESFEPHLQYLCDLKAVAAQHRASCHDTCGCSVCEFLRNAKP